MVRRYRIYEYLSSGADGGNRTLDQRFTKALLYQLSYVGVVGRLGFEPRKA